MNIAVIYTSIFPPLKGASGADRRVRDITRSLSQNQNKIWMFVPIWHNSGKPNLDSNEFEIIYLGSKVLGSNIIGRLVFWVHLITFSIKNNLDSIIIYSPILDSAPFLLILRLFKIKVFLEICDLMSAPSKNQSISRKLKSYQQYFGEQIIPKVTNGTITISEFLKQRVLKVAPNKPIFKLPILVDPNNFKKSDHLAIEFRNENNIDEKVIIITYVGGLWLNEGVDFLIKAVSRLVKEGNKNIKLIIAGKLEIHPEIVNVEKLVSDLGLNNFTILTGWVDTNKIISILSASDILVVSQIDNIFNRAGLPTKLAEYSAMGKAIVATNVGDVGCYFKNKYNAMIVEDSNIDAIKDSLDLLINNDGLRQNIGKEAENTAQNEFSYLSNGQRLLKFIESQNKN